MEWIRKGRQIGQAVKNVQRLRQITAVFARHGFDDVIVRMNLGRYLPTARMANYAKTQAERNTYVRLREAFEELGPTFVKLGQVLSTRPDVIPEGLIDELTRLQDNVAPLAYDTVKKVIEAELGRKVEEAYAYFNPQPLASASIGQVHEARLHSGEKVVVKVQRPDIRRTIENDVALLTFAARLLERYIPEARIFNPSMIVDEFFKTLAYELDFVIESNNMRKMAENLVTIPDVVIPTVYKELSTDKIITMEKFEGIRVNDLEALDRAGINRKLIVHTGARAFFKTVMIDGLFHGDLHGGNLFILPGNKLGIIDFGIVGRLSEKSRDQLASMVMSLLTEDYENLCYQYAELGNADPSIDFEGFQREVRNTLSPYMGLTLSELNAGRVLIEATRIATKYKITIPGDWMIVFKAIMTIEGMGRTLDPDFDLLAIGQELVKDLVKNQYSIHRIRKDLLWVARDLSALAQVLPRQIRWMFRKFNRNDFAFEIKSPELTHIREQLDANGKRTILGSMIAGLLVAGAISLQASTPHSIGGYPAVSVILIGSALLLMIRSIFI